MKSRKVNRIVKVLEKTVVEGEDLESVDSALQEQLEVYSEDTELEGFSGSSGARSIASASASTATAVKQKKNVDSYPTINVNYAQLSSIEGNCGDDGDSDGGFGGSAVFSVGCSG